MLLAREEVPKGKRTRTEARRERGEVDLGGVDLPQQTAVTCPSGSLSYALFFL